MGFQTAHLMDLPLCRFPELFASLEPPDPKSLRGFYQGAFAGPKWLRRLTGPMLWICGLGGWWGKHFDEQGNAINLVRRKRLGGWYMGQRLPMLLRHEASLIDGKPGISLQYASHNPLPWPLIVDELRLLQPGVLLGMSILRSKLIPRLALPFTLWGPKQAPGGSSEPD